MSGLIKSGLQEEVAAHNAKVEALRKANAEAARSVPYYQQIVAAQEEAAAAAFRASEEAQKLASGFGFAGQIALAAADNVDELNVALGRLKANDALRTQTEGLRQGGTEPSAGGSTEGGRSRQADTTAGRVRNWRRWRGRLTQLTRQRTPPLVHVSVQESAGFG